MSRGYIGGRSPSVYTVISVVFSFFVVLVTTNYASYYMPSLLPTVQRLSFIVTAGFFMALFQYSVFENWKIDLFFIIPTAVVALYLPFLEHNTAYILDVLVLAPLLEEFFFRGYMIGIVLEAATMEKESIVRAVAILTAMIVSLCAFVVMHPPSEALMALYYGFFFSVLMVAYRMLRDSTISEFAVIFPMISHFSNNLFMYIFGGPAGGSVTVLIVLILMGIWSLLAYRRFRKRLFLSARLSRSGS